MKLIYSYLLYSLLLSLSLSSCKKLVDVSPPVTSVTGEDVYTSDQTAIAAVTAVYTQLSATSVYFDGFINFSLYAGLSADEFTLFDKSNPTLIAYYKNALSVNAGGYEVWNYLYPYIYTCNTAIEGLSNANSLTPAVKQQLLGEVKFMRGFFYFYLINMYGEVPLALTSDYKVNSSLARSPSEKVYQQIIEDLKDAQNLLSENYLDASLLTSTTEKVRPTKWAAAAMLSRVYLYTADWADAEAQATAVINNTALYSLTDLDSVFLKNSNEAIWQLQPVTTNVTNTWDAFEFIIPSTGPGSSWPVYLSDNLLNSFEPGDNRRMNWVDSVTVVGTTYYYPYKYKINAIDVPVTEYIMILRLGEEYLIRAEARAQQNNISGAQTDLNLIRSRANLLNTSANDKASLLTAILHERQVELFTELGQRWLDLKRSGTVDAVMTVICPQKSSSWNSYQQLYPISLPDIQTDPNLTQNSGY